MIKLKHLIKKILIKLHLWEEKVVHVPLPEKHRPDFDIETRNWPFVSAGKGYSNRNYICEKSIKIAIQIHVFFVEIIPEVIEILNSIPVSYDCYITTDTEEKKSRIYKNLQEKCAPNYLQIDVMENRGRDVGPFIQQMAPVIDRYQYIAHLHTKKSKHTDFGDDWRHFLYRNMFGGEENISDILREFVENPKLGLVIPEVYPIVRELMAWDNTKEDVASLLSKMNLYYDLPEKPMCPVGDMFWARVDAVKPLFELGLSQKDFQEEEGQLNYTLAHVIERIWCYLVLAEGYDYKVWINGREELSAKGLNISRALVCALQDPDLDVDCSMLKKLTNYFDYILVVMNQSPALSSISWLPSYSLYMTEEKSVEGMLSDALSANRSNLETYNEIAILDNSLLGPLFNLKEVMDKMSKECYPMWSLFKAPILESSFSVFNLDEINYDVLLEMLQENRTLDIFYVKESAYIGEWLFVEKPVLELCFDYIILHSPFVKKQSLQYLPKNEKKLVISLFKEISNE